MTKTNNDQTGLVMAQLNAIENISITLGEAAGDVVFFEIKMRMIAEQSEPVRIKLNEIVKPRKGQKPNYIDCNLVDLVTATISVFGNSALLNENEQKKLEQFRTVRNKIIHGDFVGLARKLNIDLKSQDRGQSDGKPLDPKNIIEAIIETGRSNVFTETRKLAKEAQEILKKIIIQTAPSVASNPITK